LLTWTLLSLAWLGVMLAAVQLVALRGHLAKPRKAPGVLPRISVLKPLCGIDDDLWSNLESFASLDYPDYEVLLGARDRTDPAWSIAEAAAARWPGRFRSVLQRGEAGLNPKVNQLIGLAAAARHDVLLVSDSNVRAPAGYLRDVAGQLSDPGVGLVTHPVAGVGEGSLGAELENLHAAASVGPATIAAKWLFGRDVVVGKSMAFRRRDLEALGGFESVKDVLAEDYVLGVNVSRRLGKRVAIGSMAILNVNRRRSGGDFIARYGRWCVMQRKIAGTPIYASQLLLYPLPFAAAALASDPGPFTLALAVLAVGSKAVMDGVTARTLRGSGFGARVLLLSPLKDLLFLAAFLRAFPENTVEWRGNRLRVLSGSRLERVPAPVAGGGTLALGR
jgi:ceramide glucosyltransferase